MQEQTLYCLALSLIPGLGHKRIGSLIESFGSPAGVFKATQATLKKLRVAPEARASLLSGHAQRLAEGVLENTSKRDIRIFSRYDDGYPPLLAQIYDPPWILYVRGNPQLLQEPSIAVVGSRRCSVYGKEVTLQLARELASIGLTIVSGLARGVDSCAHRGAIESGGNTVAVLGNGVDVVYPRENQRLYDALVERGCIISEFPCGSFPAPQNFPVRNRIISGMGYGTVLTEAAEFSGSLITARLTLEHDRELWAVPGSINSSNSYGPNYLIKQGARVVLSYQDVIDELPVEVLDQLSTQAPPASTQKRGRKATGKMAIRDEVLSSTERRILKLLSPDASTHFDKLFDSAELDFAELNRVLLTLEMRGLIRQLPGRRFNRILC